MKFKANKLTEQYNLQIMCFPDVASQCWWEAFILFYYTVDFTVNAAENYVIVLSFP